MAQKLSPADFELGDLLGEGAFAQVAGQFFFFESVKVLLVQVFRAKMISTGVDYAAKVVDKRHVMRYNKQNDVVS